MSICIDLNKKVVKLRQKRFDYCELKRIWKSNGYLLMMYPFPVFIRQHPFQEFNTLGDGIIMEPQCGWTIIDLENKVPFYDKS